MLVERERRDHAEDERAWTEREQVAEADRGAALAAAQARATAARGRQLVEGFRAAEALVRLQDECVAALDERLAALRLPDVARDPMERIAFEQRAAAEIKARSRPRCASGGAVGDEAEAARSRSLRRSACAWPRRARACARRAGAGAGCARRSSATRGASSRGCASLSLIHISEPTRPY